MQRRAKLEDLLMERRSSEERRKKAELGYDKLVQCLILAPPVPFPFLCGQCLISPTQR